MAADIINHKDSRIHFIGIGGCSMSGLARILKSQGYHVTGSDVKESAFVNTLRKDGIEVHIGHDAALVDGAGAIVYTAAIKPTNPEFARAMELGLPMIERSVLLGQISRAYENVVCVSGCHGKTTITSMLALISEDTALGATVHVGGMVNFLGGGVKVGDSDVFITEACEYVRSFMTLHPKNIILNNIDDDHLDYYKDIDEIIDTFADFIRMLPADGKLFVNIDDANNLLALEKVSAPSVVTYAIEADADYVAKNIEFDEFACGSFDVYHKGANMGRIKLNVPGKYNVLNALATFVLAHETFGTSIDAAADALKHYTLAGRRFEFVGEKDGVKVFHDYAHHPSEIAACLSAAKVYPHKKLWVLFQCNSYTRAKTLKDKYALVFDGIDEVLVPDIYPGRDIDKGEIHATDLVNAINAHSDNCRYLPTFADIKAYLHENWQPGDLVVTLGSGDVNKQQLVLLED